MTFLGLPLTVCVPMREKDGDRVALLELNMHATSVEGTNPSTSVPVEMKGPETEEDGQTIEKEGSKSVSKDSKINIAVTFDQGSVNDPSWWLPLEPFVECTLLPPPSVAQKSSSSLQSCKLKDRSVFIQQVDGKRKALAMSSMFNSEETTLNTDGSGIGEQDQSKTSTAWDLRCELSIPEDCLPDADAEYGGEEISNVKWTMMILVRDASRMGCPEVGWARGSVPWSVLQFNVNGGMTQTGGSMGNTRGTNGTNATNLGPDGGLEQWVDIVPPSTSKEKDKCGRLHMRIATFDRELLLQEKKEGLIDERQS